MARGKSEPDRRVWLVVAILALVALMPETAFAQCAMCRTALRSPEGQRMIAALRNGIYLLLAAPFAVFGTVATLAVRRFQSARNATAFAAPRASTHPTATIGDQGFRVLGAAARPPEARGLRPEASLIGSPLRRRL